MDDNKNLNEFDYGELIIGSLTFNAAIILLTSAKNLFMYRKQMKELPKIVEKNPKILITNEKLTEKLIEITGDVDIKAVMISKKLKSWQGHLINAFNMGTPEVFYTESLGNWVDNENQLISILLHEYGHYKERHVTKAVLRGATLGAMFKMTLAAIAYNFLGEFPQMYVTFKNVLNLFFPSVDASTNYFALIGSRRAEFISDSYARKYGYGNALAQTFRKLEKELKQEVCKNIDSPQRCDDIIREMQEESTHPSYQERIEQLSMVAIKYVMKLKPNMSLRNFFRGWKLFNVFKTKTKKEIKEHGFGYVSFKNDV